MALIIMCCHDTEANGRSEYTSRTLQSLSKTVNWNKHRLIVVDNGSCKDTKELLFYTKNMPDTGNFGYRIPGISIITNPVNLGTAKGINQGLKLRESEEYVIKLDNDVEFGSAGWVDEMEECFLRDPGIGILGLKRKDVNFDGQYVALPHKPGERWITVETGGQIMGTCTMFNWRLIDNIGGMKQVGVYGMDDCLYDLRSNLAGFYNDYLPHINIDHIDRGDNPYTREKQRIAGESWPEYMAMHEGYINGTRPLWEDFE